MEIHTGIRSILRLMTCTVGGYAAWMALSVFRAPTVYKNAIEGAVLVNVWHCTAFDLATGIGWIIGYKTKWGKFIASALLG